MRPPAPANGDGEATLLGLGAAKRQTHRICIERLQRAARLVGPVQLLLHWEVDGESREPEFPDGVSASRVELEASRQAFAGLRTPDLRALADETAAAAADRGDAPNAAPQEDAVAEEERRGRKRAAGPDRIFFGDDGGFDDGDDDDGNGGDDADGGAAAAAVSAALGEFMAVMRAG